MSATLPVGTPTPRRWRIGLAMFDDMELLDHAGPYEVFTTAERMARRLAGPVASASRTGFEVVNLAREDRPVRARAGVRLLPDATLDAAPTLDLLVVPGGDVSAALEDRVLLDWIAAQARQVPWLASICTGVFLLGRAGVLPDGAAVTTHWEDLDDLCRAHPTLDVRADRRWVLHDGPRPCYTSGGISAGLDLSLHLVERMAGRALAERTARQLDYRWIEA